ncbi:hypothetical protein [Tautonia sociabilis]|uniref:Uncharacterized protein n=1 Tax=Tautonia sociabilis TaxID=2080755 RepID=A0A432MHZ7_9BACT|nr:hypothetical protein [Tautonia sociabilis]RUL86994.1 hypothetical protein TsocGM_14450 [Tautonia sociabilis]
MNELIKPPSVGSFGSAGELVLEDVITTILDITIKAWPRVVAGGKVSARSSEDDISDELRWQMDAEKRRRNPMPRLRFEREPQSDLPDKSRSIGLIDVYVIYSFEQTEYFAIECKRLADADSDLSRYYVTDGVNRFVIGKYSLGHPYGAMVGYVCAGECGVVASQIEKRLKDFDRAVTAISSSWMWRQEDRFGRIPNLFSTKHTQVGIQHEITLLHLFVSLN